MLKYMVPGLIGLTACLLFVIIPLDRFIHTDASGQHFTVVAAPPLSSKYDIFKHQWWRNPESVRKARAMFPLKTDAEFLDTFPRENKAYPAIAAALRQQPSEQPHPDHALHEKSPVSNP